MLIAGTDYTMDAVNGIITALPGGAIARRRTVKLHTHTPKRSLRRQAKGPD